MLNRIEYHRRDLGFYRKQSDISSPGKHGALYADLPTEIHELCHTVQNLLLHQFWILEEKNYGISAKALIAAGRRLNEEINLRSVEELIDFLLQMDNRPLTAPRDVQNRVVGNCRDYALLLVSILRHRGIPARVRSGVARYFLPEQGHLEDHFICEFWNRAEERWQQADAQIDEVQRKALDISMDMADLPPDQFLNAGESYRLLESGQVAPEKIGIMEFTGQRYVHYKLVSDLACICGVEILAWEGWGLVDDLDNLTEADVALLTEIAEILVRIGSDPGQFGPAMELFQGHPRLQMPADYQPYYFELPFFKDR